MTEQTDGLEWSDDLKRGERPEIRAAIAAVRTALVPRNPCQRCRNRAATHLIDQCKRAVCASCADIWRSMTPLERAQSRIDFARRG